MRVVQAGGSVFLGGSLAVRGDKHVEIATLPRRTLAFSPCVLMSTLSGTAPSLSACLSPSRIPE